MLSARSPRTLALLGGLGLLAVATLSPPSRADGALTKTDPTCANAHAVLAASATGDHTRLWSMIGRVAQSQPYRWKLVPEHEPGISQKMALKQWDNKFHEGVTAYVAHCGSGETCNDFAEVIFKSYPSIGSPTVYCGPVPHILDNPVSANLPQ